MGSVMSTLRDCNLYVVVYQCDLPNGVNGKTIIVVINSFTNVTSKRESGVVVSDKLFP